MDKSRPYFNVQFDISNGKKSLIIMVPGVAVGKHHVHRYAGGQRRQRERAQQRVQHAAARGGLVRPESNGQRYEESVLQNSDQFGGRVGRDKFEK